MKTPSLHTKKRPLAIGTQRGFSLVELLVVIAVIGIIAAIAIPNIANLTGSAQVAANQRNAQNIASVFSAARAAGVTTSWADLTTAIAAFCTTNGVVQGSGANAMTFRIDALSVEQQSNATTYLRWDGTNIYYNP